MILIEIENTNTGAVLRIPERKRALPVRNVGNALPVWPVQLWPYSKTLQKMKSQSDFSKMIDKDPLFWKIFFFLLLIVMLGVSLLLAVA